MNNLLTQGGWEEAGWGEGGPTHLNGYQAGRLTYEFGVKREIMNI